MASSSSTTRILGIPAPIHLGRNHARSDARGYAGNAAMNRSRKATQFLLGRYGESPGAILPTINHGPAASAIASANTARNASTSDIVAVRENPQPRPTASRSMPNGEPAG